MRQANIQREISRLQRYFAIGAAIFFLLVALVLVFARYTVPLSADYQHEGGEWYWLNPAGDEQFMEAESQRTILEGEGLRLTENGAGRLELLPESRAFAYFLGGAEWRLIEFNRTGTTWQHLRRSGVDYEVRIEQLGGVVLYDFSQADPALADLNLTLRLPNGEFEPTFDCFQVTVPAEAESEGTVVEIPCAVDENGLRPAQLPTLP